MSIDFIARGLLTKPTAGPTIEDKQHESISVADFGATGDGKTDDTVAIQLALETAHVTGRRVHFPAGVYSIGKLRVHGDKP